MSSNNSYSKIQNSFIRNNRIRTKLLLFVDNEIQSKIKQSCQKLKFNYDIETQNIIIFEETFTHKQENKYEFLSSFSTKTKLYDNSDKTLSTMDVSSNKIIKLKSTTEEEDYLNKSLNNSICFNKKIYSIKNVSRHSRTFLILAKQKKGAEYLKTLCNSLKISKSDKKPIKHIKSNCNAKSKFFNLCKYKKTSENEINIQKDKKDDQYTYSLFRKSQKGKFLIKSRHQVCKK